MTLLNAQACFYIRELLSNFHSFQIGDGFETRADEGASSSWLSSASEAVVVGSPILVSTTETSSSIMNGNY